ncbi:MAG: flippase [Methanobrevibacter sp.]
MVNVRTIFKNSTWMMGSQIITNLCAFIWTILMARYLGASVFGILSFAISLSTLVGILMDCGTQTYIVRAISRDSSLTNKLFNQIVPLKVILSIIVISVTIFVLFLTGRTNDVINVSFIMLCQYAFLCMNGFFYGIFQAYEKMEYQSIASVINSLILLAIVFIVMHFNLGLYGMAFAYLIAIFCAFIYIYSRITKVGIKPHYSFSIDFSKKILKAALPFGLISIFYSIYFTIDVTMLQYLSTNVAVGLYNAAYKVISILTTFYAVYPQVIFPVMSKLFKDSNELLRFSYEKSIKYLLLIILPICAGIIVYAEPLMAVIYGKGYIGTGAIVTVLTFSIPFLFVNGASTVALNSSNNEILVTKTYACAAVINIILNLILIPKYSYFGAAFATVISEIIITFIMFRATSKSDYALGWVLVKDLIKLLIATVLMFIVLNYLKLNIVFGIIVGAIIYFGALFATRILDSDDKKIIRIILNKE